MKSRGVTPALTLFGDGIQDNTFIRNKFCSTREVKSTEAMEKGGTDADQLKSSFCRCPIGEKRNEPCERGEEDDKK